jgi:hypothetical protein
MARLPPMMRLRTVVSYHRDNSICLSDDDNPRVNAGRASLGAGKRELALNSYSSHHCLGTSVCGASYLPVKLLASACLIDEVVSYGWILPMLGLRNVLMSLHQLLPAVG